MELGFQVNLVVFEQHFPIERRLKLDFESLKTAIGASHTYPQVECLDISSCGIDDALISAVCTWIVNGNFVVLKALNLSLNHIGSRGWKILSHYLRVGTCFQELIMLNVQHNAHPGGSAVVMAVKSALPGSAQLGARLVELDKVAFFRRKYKRENKSRMPLASLEILILDHSFDLDHSLVLKRQIRDGLFPSLRRLQLTTGYRLDQDGRRIHRAVCALERTMESQISHKTDVSSSGCGSR